MEKEIIDMNTINFEKLDKKIENTMQRIAEVEEKIQKLETERDRLYKDLRSNLSRKENPEKVQKNNQPLKLSNERKNRIIEKSRAFGNRI